MSIIQLSITYRSLPFPLVSKNDNNDASILLYDLGRGEKDGGSDSLNPVIYAKTCSSAPSKK